MQHSGREYARRTVRSVFEAVPTVPQIEAEQVIEAVGQVAVLLVSDARLAVRDLLLALGAVVVAQLVNQVFGQLAAPHIDTYLPAAVAVEYLIDEIAPHDLRRLLLEQLERGVQYASAERIENLGVVVHALFAGGRALQSRRVTRDVHATDMLVAASLQ